MPTAGWLGKGQSWDRAKMVVSTRERLSCTMKCVLRGLPLHFQCVQLLLCVFCHGAAQGEPAAAAAAAAAAAVGLLLHLHARDCSPVGW
jgi:hypothetical protein